MAAICCGIQNFAAGYRYRTRVISNPSRSRFARQIDNKKFVVTGMGAECPENKRVASRLSVAILEIR